MMTLTLVRLTNIPYFVKRLITGSEESIQYIGIEQKFVPLKKRDETPVND